MAGKQSLSSGAHFSPGQAIVALTENSEKSDAKHQVTGGQETWPHVYIHV